MNGSDQRNAFLIHLPNGIFKPSITVFNDNILIAWYCPFCPSVRRFCMINTFYSCQIQALTKAIFPGLKRVRKIRHSTPYSHKIPISVFLCQMRYLTKMTVCIIPQFLNKTFTI